MRDAVTGSPFSRPKAGSSPQGEPENLAARSPTDSMHCETEVEAQSADTRYFKAPLEGSCRPQATEGWDCTTGL